MLSSPVLRSLGSKRRRMLGVSPDAFRLMRESAVAGNKLLTSPWAVAFIQQHRVAEDLKFAAPVGIQDLLAVGTCAIDVLGA